MEKFKISEAGINRIQKRAIFKLIPVYILLLIGIIWMNIDMLNSLLENKLNYILPFFILIPFVIGYSISWKRIKNQLRSYTLTITNDEVIREQYNTPTIRHRKSDITEITKNYDNSFTIKGQFNNDLIGISSQIDDFEILENRLNQIKTVKIKNSNVILEYLKIPLSILVIILMGCVFKSTNAWLVIVSGIILTLFFIYSLFTIYKSKTIDNSTRRGMYFMIIPMIAILGRMYLINSPKYSQFQQNSENKELIQQDSIEGELISTIEIFTNAKAEDTIEYKNGLIAGIELDEPNFKDLNKPNEVVLPYNDVTLEIDYPLDTIYIGNLKTANKGFTRLELVTEISKRYHQIYQEEEATAKVKTIPPDKRGETLNRNQTDGKYAIWGHDLSDLYLMEIEVYKTKEGKIILRLNIES